MDLQNYIYCRFSPPRLNRNYLNSIVDEADWPINTNPEHGLNILGHSNLDSWKTRDHRLRKRQETFAHAIRIRSSESIPYYVKELSGIMRQKNVLPPRDEDNPPYCVWYGLAAEEKLDLFEPIIWSSLVAIVGFMVLGQQSLYEKLRLISLFSSS